MDVQPGTVRAKIYAIKLQNIMIKAIKETNSPVMEHIRKGTTLNEVMPFIANSNIFLREYFVSPAARSAQSKAIVQEGNPTMGKVARIN